VGHLPSSLFSNSKDIRGRVCSETKCFERERGDTPSFDRLLSCERGDAQESKFVILPGSRSNEVLAKSRGVTPARKRARGQLADALHHTRRTGPLAYILLAYFPAFSQPARTAGVVD
jgi:hypothetical protein